MKRFLHLIFGQRKTHVLRLNSNQAALEGPTVVFNAAGDRVQSWILFPVEFPPQLGCIWIREAVRR